MFLFRLLYFSCKIHLLVVFIINSINIEKVHNILYLINNNLIKRLTEIPPTTEVVGFLSEVIMKKRNYKEMSNSELKLQIESLRNIFESKKNMLKNICEEMGEVEKEYLNATHELKIRKNILL